MTWHAPDVGYLLEERLRRVRESLTEDAPFNLADSGQSDELPDLLLQKVEDKFFSAAQDGYAAVAANLRIDASDWLRRQGCGADAIPEALREAEARLTVYPHHELRRRYPSWLNFRNIDRILRVATLLYLAGIFFVAWAIWQMYHFAAIATFVIGVFPVLRNPRSGRNTIRGTNHWIVREYPANLCRQYMRAFNDAVLSYAEIINQRANGSA